MLKTNVEIGFMIYNYRKKSHLSQKELASQLNVTVAAISNWERGQAKPNIVVCEMLARMMDLSLDQFLVSNNSEDTPIYQIFDKIFENTFTLEIVSLEPGNHRCQIAFSLEGMHLTVESILEQAHIQLKIKDAYQSLKALSCIKAQKKKGTLKKDIFILKVEVELLNEESIIQFDFNGCSNAFKLENQVIQMIINNDEFLNEDKDTLNHKIESPKFETYIRFIIKNNNYHRIIKHYKYLLQYK